MAMPTTMPNFYLLTAFQAEICKHHDTKTYLACTIQLSININMDSYIHTYIHIKPNTYTYMIYIVATPLDDDRDREVQEYLLAARNIYSGLLIISVTTHDDPEQRTSTGCQINS